MESSLFTFIRTRNAEHGTRNTERGTQNAERDIVFPDREALFPGRQQMFHIARFTGNDCKRLIV